jgi:hypothetical protein
MYDLLKNERIDRINNMIELAQANYIGNVGSHSRKGFYNYKSFINRMESRKHIEERNINESTIWDKIKRYENERSKNN